MHQDNWYTLSGLVRGQYGTNAISHSAGERFVRVDEALFRYPYRKEDIGKTIHLKFTSMNLFGSNEQELDEVQAYQYTLTPYFIPEVTGLTLYTKYYEITNRVKSFDVVAEFNVPHINSLDTVEIWYREPSGQWKYGGAGEGQVIISGCELGHTYEVKAVVKDTHGNTSQGVSKNITVELKSEIPNKPLGFSISFSDMAHFNWLEVRNADVDYYELRLDLRVGQNDGLIGRSNNTTYSGMLRNRTGKVYLYAHNPAKGYGAPAELTYNVPQPKQPTNLKATANINGIGVTFEAIPANCKGANVYVDSKVYFTTTNALTIPLEAGVYNVKVAYVDIFGEGPATQPVSVAVKAKIDKALLDMESLGISDMDKAVKALKAEVGTVKSNVNGFNSKLIDQANAFQRTVNDLNRNVSSQITQISNGIELKVTNALGKLDGRELISRINLTPAGTRIDGKLLHVTGQAKFDDNIITNKMLQADSVNARNIQVNSLSSISVNTGDLTGGSITGGTFKNSTGTFEIDRNGNIKGANITGSRIDADSIFQSGYKIKNIDVRVYTVKHGDYCPIPEGFTEKQCTFIPVGYKMTEDYSDVTGGTRDGRKKWDNANERRIDYCTMYFQSNISSGYHDTKPTIGLNGREAVCQSIWYSYFSNRDDNGYHKHISFGVLYVLVIGKK